MLSLETQQPQSGSFKTKVVAAVTATAAIGIVAAVTLSSSSASAARKATGLFNIPEDIKGHFSGGQITGEWTVQGKFHKFEDSKGDWQINSKLTVEGPNMGGSETYTLVDNVLVMEPQYTIESAAKIQCGTRENLPAYSKWADVLESGAVMNEDKMNDDLKKAVTENCPAGSTSVAVIVDQRSYVICADSTANTRSMYAFNRDFSFSAVSREGMTVDIQHPTGWEALNCTTFDPSLTRDQAAQKAGLLEDDADRELMMGDYFDNGGMTGFNSGQGEGQYGQSNTLSQFYSGGWGSGGSSGSSSSSPNQRSCAFFHGVGGDGYRVGLQYRFNDYWGPNKVGKRCSNTNKYHDSDTQTQGYNTLAYHKEICNALYPSTYTEVGAAAHDDWATMSESVIFTHSMGGLSTRRAFADNVCSWGGHYYQSQCPMSGSRAATFARNACDGLSYSLVGWLVQHMLLGAYCERMGGSTHYGYTTIYADRPTYASGGKRSQGRLCGTQFRGLGGFNANVLGIIQFLAGLQRRNDWCVIPKISCGWRGCRTVGCYRWYRCPYNDGMVSWDRCAQHHRAYGAQVKRMGINHQDGTGRMGDRSGGASIDQWFQARSMLDYNGQPTNCEGCLTRYGAWG